MNKNKIPVICKKCGIVMDLLDDDTFNFSLEVGKVVLIDTCKECETTKRSKT